MLLNSNGENLYAPDSPYVKHGYKGPRLWAGKLADWLDAQVARRPTLQYFTWVGECPMWGIFSQSAIVRLAWFHVMGFIGHMIVRCQGYALYDQYAAYYDCFGHMDALRSDGYDWDEDLRLLPRWFANWWLGGELDNLI